MSVSMFYCTNVVLVKKPSMLLRDSVTRFLPLGFLHESVFPEALSILLIPFLIFPKIHGGIGSSRYTTGVVDTSVK
jgi:hypothetical protein